MARAKSKKWAAESLVSETESKAIASPKQQRKAGEAIAVMLGGGAAGFVGKQIVKQIGKKIVTRAADKKAAKAAAKKTVKKKTEIEAKKNREAFEKKAKRAAEELSELYHKAHPRTSHSMQLMSDIQESVRQERHPPRGKKAKGGYVKKYAKGGGVRAARY